MNLSIEQLVEIVVRQVLAELEHRGVPVRGALPGPNGRNGTHASRPASAPAGAAAPGPGGARLEVDLSGYKTPVLTENHVRAAGRHIREIAVPAGTICTAGARDLLEQRRLALIVNGKTS